MNKQLPIATPKQRLKVYKKTLKVVTKDIERGGAGLCIDLRRESGNTSLSWVFAYTSDYFPEFKHYFFYQNHVFYHPQIKFKKQYESNKRKWRIKILKLIIEKLEKSNK